MYENSKGISDDELLELMKVRMKKEGTLSLFYNEGNVKWGNCNEIKNYAKIVRASLTDVESLANICTKINPCMSYKDNVEIISNMKNNIVEIHDIIDVEELHKCIVSVGYIDKYLGIK